MNNFLSSLKDLFKIASEHWSQIKTSLIILLICFAATLYMMNANLHRQHIIDVQNYSAAKDSTRVVKLKNGQLETQRLIYLGEKNISDSLKKELKAEKEKKSKVIYISTGTLSITHDSVKVPTIVYVDSNKNVHFSWSIKQSGSGWSKELEGISDKDSTTLTKDIMNLQLITGYEKNKSGQYQMFVRSPYNGIKFNGSESCLLDYSGIIPKKKHIALGLGAFYGVSNKGLVYGAGATLNWIVFSF